MTKSVRCWTNSRHSAQSKILTCTHVTVSLRSDEQDCGSRIEIRNSPTAPITENLKELKEVDELFPLTNNRK